MLLVLTLWQALSQALAASGGSHWTYEGPHGQAHWTETYPDCGRQAQSPLDIQTSLVQYDPSLPPIEPEGYRDPGSSSLTLTNNGHTVQLSLPEDLRLHGLPSIYSAVQLHFHWGGSKGHAGGSEHRVDGRAFPAELHVVHFNSEKYANLSVAERQPDGLAVLSIFLEVDSVENPAYSHILDHLENIVYAEQEVTVAPFSVRELLPAHLGRYYRYNGSLTTPPCYQSVLWTVFHQPARISAAQLEKLQKSLHSTKAGKTPPELLVSNFRAPQFLNQRVVSSSFPVGPSGHSAGEIIAIIAAALLGCLGVFLAGWILAKRTRMIKKRQSGTWGGEFRIAVPIGAAKEELLGFYEIRKKAARWGSKAIREREDWQAHHRVLLGACIPGRQSRREVVWPQPSSPGEADGELQFAEKPVFRPPEV